MPLLTRQYTINAAQLPLKDDALQVMWKYQTTQFGKQQIILYPKSTTYREPKYVRFMCGMDLTVGDGTKAGRLGQLLVTGSRLVGMVTDGSVGPTQLDSATGKVFVFSIDRDEIYLPEVKTNWRGKPVEAQIRCKEEAKPAFALAIFSVAVVIGNDGGLSRPSMTDLLDRLSDNGRQRLLD